MSKWIVLENGRNFVFDNYQDAKTDFLTKIADHLWLNSFNNASNDSAVYDRSCTPSVVGLFFEKDYNDRTILDEEIVIQTRLDMLLDYFLSKDATGIKNNALKVIKRPIKYHGEKNEYNQTIDISVELNPSEIVVDIKGEDSVFKTNAFIFDNELHKYYFKSKQRIISSSDPQHVGKFVELDIVLSPYDEIIKEMLYEKEKEETELYIIGQYRKYAHIGEDYIITEDNINEQALIHVSCYQNYDIHDLRELLLSQKEKKLQ